jgi:hypothetical protein
LEWNGDKDVIRKSIAAYVFMYGNAAVPWCSKKEAVVTLSSRKAEYIAASLTACQAQWIIMLMLEMNM